MSNKYISVSEEELNAYFDGELDEAGQLRVEAYLASNREIAKDLAYDRLINTGMHRLYDPILCEPVPEHFYQQVMQKSHFLKNDSLLKVAMVAGVMMLSGFSGWMINAYQQTTAVPVLAHLVQPASFAHVVYSTDPRYPVEFNANDQNKLADWLSQRMHSTISAPSLSEIGYELIGGRLLPSTNRMAAMFMYQNAAMQRITLYIRRNVWKDETTNISYTEENGVQVVYWYNGIMGYAVSGEIDKNKLIIVAQAVQRALKKSAVIL